MENERLGIIGTGFTADKFAEAVKNSDGSELIAVASRTMESAKVLQ